MIGATSVLDFPPVCDQILYCQIDILPQLNVTTETLNVVGTKRGEIQVNPIHFYRKNKQ